MYTSMLCTECLAFLLLLIFYYKSYTSADTDEESIGTASILPWANTHGLGQIDNSDDTNKPDNTSAPIGGGRRRRRQVASCSGNYSDWDVSACINSCGGCRLMSRICTPKETFAPLRTETAPCPASYCREGRDPHLETVLSRRGRFVKRYRRCCYDMRNADPDARGKLRFPRRCHGFKTQGWACRIMIVSGVFTELQLSLNVMGLYFLSSNETCSSDRLSAVRDPVWINGDRTRAIYRVSQELWMIGPIENICIDRGNVASLKLSISPERIEPSSSAWLEFSGTTWVASPDFKIECLQRY